MNDELKILADETILLQSVKALLLKRYERLEKALEMDWTTDEFAREVLNAKSALGEVVNLMDKVTTMHRVSLLETRHRVSLLEVINREV